MNDVQFLGHCTFELEKGVFNCIHFQLLPKICSKPLVVTNLIDPLGIGPLGYDIVQNAFT